MNTPELDPRISAAIREHRRRMTAALAVLVSIPAIIGVCSVFGLFSLKTALLLWGAFAGMVAGAIVVMLASGRMTFYTARTDKTPRAK